MKTRILTSIVAICILLPVLYFSETAALPAAIALVAVISIYEMLGCIGVKKLYISLPIYAAASAMPFLLRYVGDGHVFALLKQTRAVIGRPVSKKPHICMISFSFFAVIASISLTNLSVRS